MTNISINKEQLVEAFQSWYDDYTADPTKFKDYDVEGYDGSNYAVESATALINYINKIQGE